MLISITAEADINFFEVMSILLQVATLIATIVPQLKKGKSAPMRVESGSKIKRKSNYSSIKNKR